MNSLGENPRVQANGDKTIETLACKKKQSSAVKINSKYLLLSPVGTRLKKWRTPHNVKYVVKAAVETKAKILTLLQKPFVRG